MHGRLLVVALLFVSPTLVAGSPPVSEVASTLGPWSMAVTVPGHGATISAPEAVRHAVPGPLTMDGQRHVDASASSLYVAQSLTSARFAVGAVKEQFLGRAPWFEPVTGSGVRVAVVDTGIDPTHPDLEGSIVAWRDFVRNRPEPYDDDTHGTHVAGIIAAHGHFQSRPDRHYFPFGARGVAPGVDLIIAKAMDASGDGDAHQVAAAIRWALDPNGDGDPSDGAHVINLSIGVELPPEQGQTRLPGPVTLPGIGAQTEEEVRAVREAILTAIRMGAIVVVAAGNHEPGAAQNTVTFPGTMPEVITVGAVDSDGRPAEFSNAGTPGSRKPDLVAPGVLLSTFPVARDLEDSQRDGYVALGGTSMAAPMVAGAVALMLEADPSLRGLSATRDLSHHASVVRNALVRSADGSGGHDPVTGFGLLQVDAAVDAVDVGTSDLNWDVLLLALAVGVLVAFLRVRRHRRARSSPWARAEARARREATRNRETSGVPVFHLDDAEPVPAWQRPPWEGLPDDVSGASEGEPVRRLQDASDVIDVGPGDEGLETADGVGKTGRARRAMESGDG